MFNSCSAPDTRNWDLSWVEQATRFETGSRGTIEYLWSNRREEPRRWFDRKLDVLLWWRCGWRTVGLVWFKVMLEGGFASFCLDVRFLEGTVTDRNRCMRFHCTRAPPPLQLRSSGDCWWHVLSAQLSIPSGGSTFAHCRTWCNGAILGYAASLWWFSIYRARFVV